ncbi:MAG: hypothetical protein FH758_05415 [Firmicutes bacterium]|nr:hypothetical protein [Bacillota bacterium]
MDVLLILRFILNGVPESAALIFTTLAIVGYRASFRIIFFNAFIITAIIYLLRMTLVPHGIHTVFGMVVLALVVYKIAKVSVGTAIFAVSGVIFILVNVEFVSCYLAESLFDYKLYFQLDSDAGWLWIIFGLPQVLIMWAVGYCIHKYLRPLVLKYSGKEVYYGK